MAGVNYNFGQSGIGSYSIIERTKTIKSLCEKSTQTAKLEFQGVYQPLKIIRVSIWLPAYRLANGRTKTYQLQYLAGHPDLPENFFTADNESIEAQLAQNQILLKMIDDEDLRGAFKNPTIQQTDAIICTSSGVVVNGNRRLCAWRNLFETDQVKYKHFAYIDIMVLPECDENAIVELEKRLQIQRDHRAKYKWHTIAYMAKEERDVQGKKPSEIAATYDLSASEVTSYIECWEWASEYLISQGMKNQWSEVDDSKHAFEQFAKQYRKLTDIGHKELFKELAFTFIRQGSSEGRLYDVIPDIGENISKISQELSSQIVPVAPVEEEENDDSDLLGNDEVVDVDSSSAVAAAVKSSADSKQIIQLTETVIEEAKQVKKDQIDRKYLSNRLRKAASILTEIIASTVDVSESDLSDVPKRIESIEKSISEIKGWLE